MKKIAHDVTHTDEVKRGERYDSSMIEAARRGSMIS